MSEAVSALNGASFDGFVTVKDAGLHGMITLRGDLSSDVVKAAVQDVTGASVPGQRAVSGAGGNWVAWMSPDELLLVVAYDTAPQIEADLRKALSGTHHLVANVSDARAVFRLSGNPAALREAIAKLCPVDMTPGAFGPGEIRRTRMAQIPAAFWLDEGGTFHVVCFRSVADYAFNILKTAALPGGEVGVYG